MVRQALKNQKRNQKIAVADNSIHRQLTAPNQGCNSSQNSNQGSVSAVQRIQRLRISSNNKVRQLEEPPMVQQPHFIRHGNNLPKVNNQKMTVLGGRSLSSSGQKVIQTNTQLIKNKMRISKNGQPRDNSYTSQNSAYSNNSNNFKT